MPDAGEDARAFWAFSLDFYGRPGVADACLALQDREGKDVNLVLWCLWVGWSGRGRLAAEDLAGAETAAAPWRREVVVPLRSVRRALKGSPVPGAEALREQVKALELESERLQHEILARIAPEPSPACGRGQGEGLQQGVTPPPDPLPQAGEGERRAAAAANLRLYLGADLPEATTLAAAL